MQRSLEQLREDALAIWQAGVDAVRSDRLVASNVLIEDQELILGAATASPVAAPLSDIDRLIVIGAGKAGAGMAAGLEQAIGPELAAAKSLQGWVNVPDNCVRPLSRIHLHGARPGGVNEPTAAGVAGAQRILELVEGASPRDLVICLISGGGSALLPAPIEGISLEDKQQVTQWLSGAGANIGELNTVRKQLSRIKGGALARACRAGRLVSLIISDVLGDPLDVIASGPTVENTTSATDALAVIERFEAIRPGVPPAIRAVLEQAAQQPAPAASDCETANVIIGNNAVAVDAAGVEAERRGYSHAMTAATTHEGQAEDIGRHLAEMALSMCNRPGPDCLITGGEPVVQLAPPDQRGKGGRNQQLVLAAFDEILARGGSFDGIAILSGGTDGEDGPTDAAGAFVDAAVANTAADRSLSPQAYLQRNDAYHFFEQTESLIKTGPTDTNVCDVRVAVVNPPE